MPSLRDIRRRIRSVRNTRQITKAMKMIAAAKLRRAQEQILAARPYANKLMEVMASLAARVDRERHPLLAKREVRRVELVVITGDRGLCGAFNWNILREADRLLAREAAAGHEPRLNLIGRKGRDYYRRRPYPRDQEVVGVFGGQIDYKVAAQVAKELIEQYAAAEYDRLYLVYNEFKSALQQRVTVEQLLPIEPAPVPEGTTAVDYIYEPDADQILGALLPKYVEVELFRALLESQAAELGARMTAMDNATNNATEMIDALTLQFNRARQAAITKELMEVISGAEALK
ncbi:MAG TPA: ATP synthase F1 subunit gamma [Thermodesulfobacteriota bacterium]|nr:ATP synthase F1 subunit gamma [Thermodesulfobacteriota bacterium]